jgi:beta-lactamase superfamily II metal-dependent hydrolase
MHAIKNGVWQAGRGVTAPLTPSLAAVLDMVLLTHNDGDHYEGLMAILALSLIKVISL